MIIKEFNVDFSHTVNLGNYESAKLMFGVTVSLPENATKEELDKYKRELWELCFKEVRDKANDIKARVLK